MNPKTWLITGAASGLGRALAEEVLRHGDNVVLGVRHPDAVADLTARHSEATAVAELDVTRPDQITAALALATQRFGGPDIVVNNAGRGLLAALEETDDDRMARTLEINLIGPLRLMRAAVPVLRARGGGHIINVSAIAVWATEPGFTVYGAAKAGLEAASEALATEVAPFGIRVTVVIPGPFRTGFIAHSVEQVPRLPEYAGTVGRFAAVLQRIDGRQPGDPARAAAAIRQIAQADAPPFRLVLGRYANEKLAQDLTRIRAGLDQWRDVGYPTDFTV